MNLMKIIHRTESKVEPAPTPPSLDSTNELLSHELRTGITSIQAALRLLQTADFGILSDRGGRLLEIALKNSHRLLRLAQLLENQPPSRPLSPPSAVERFRLEKDLHTAIKQGEFLVFYQPIVRTETGKIAGFEALIRWFHPRWSWVMPAKFIPLAEETGLIEAIGEWVLRQACEQMESWRRQFFPKTPLNISVNLSTLQLSDPEFSLRVEQILRKTGLDPERLQLEITESAFLENSPTAITNLQHLKRQGVRLHIDDFGTGYSCLARLQDWPIDLLKIDNSFVRSGKWKMIEAILMVARSLNVEVIAEGVETEADRIQLCQLGCSYSQGYLFSGPVSGEQAGLLLARQFDCD